MLTNLRIAKFLTIGVSENEDSKRCHRTRRGCWNTKFKNNRRAIAMMTNDQLEANVGYRLNQMSATAHIYTMSRHQKIGFIQSDTAFSSSIKLVCWWYDQPRGII